MKIKSILIIDLVSIGTWTSFFNLCHLWDSPNAWSPLQEFVIQGLDHTNYEPA